MRTNFKAANLTQADFSNTNLLWAICRQTNLSGADFTNANLTAANFSEADLRGLGVSFHPLSNVTGHGGSQTNESNLNRDAPLGRRAASSPRYIACD